MAESFVDRVVRKAGQSAVLMGTLAATAVLFGARHIPFDQLSGPMAAMLEVERLAEWLVGAWVTPFAGLASSVLHIVPGYVDLLRSIGWNESALVNQHPVAYLQAVSLAFTVVTGAVGAVSGSTKRMLTAEPAVTSAKTPRAGSADAAVPQPQAGKRRPGLQRMNPWR